MMKLMRAFLSIFCGGAVLLGIAAASFAAKLNESVAGPFFNPATNSYFQLFQHPLGRIQGESWPRANARATTKRHKGERGHLAIVKDPKTLEFVRKKFTIDTPTWIGVRFFCKYRKLIWVNGDVQAPKAPGMWHRKWYRNTATNCKSGNVNFMPVYLTSSGGGDAVWQASGSGKGFYNYLVEFPAPKKSEDVSQGLKDNMTMPTEASTHQ